MGRHVRWAGGLAAAVLVLKGRAFAQQPADRSNSQFHLERHTEMNAATHTAQERFAAGDCVGALVAFDQAIRVNRDPLLRRDRGLCHEKLGHPFPAMDDYRVYLSEKPEASDWEDVRHRLVALEDQNGPRREPSKREESTSTISMSASVGGANNTRKVESKRTDVEGVREDEEAVDQAYDSPLRLGTGPIVGVYFGLRKFVGSTAPTGMGYAGGLSLGHSFGRVVSLTGELGYVSLDTPTVAVGGLGVHVDLEFRLALNRLGGDSLLLAVGPGHEDYSGAGAATGSSVFIGRARVGYRHAFGPNLGLEATVDPAVALVHAYNLPVGVSVDDKVYGMFGGSVGVVVGF